MLSEDVCMESVWECFMKNVRSGMHFNAAWLRQHAALIGCGKVMKLFSLMADYFTERFSKDFNISAAQICTKH